MNFSERKKRIIGTYTESITYYFVSRRLKEKKKIIYLALKSRWHKWVIFTVYTAIFYIVSELIKIYTRRLSFSTKLKNMLFFPIQTIMMVSVKTDEIWYLFFHKVIPEFACKVFMAKCVHFHVNTCAMKYEIKVKLFLLNFNNHLW